MNGTQHPAPPPRFRWAVLVIAGAQLMVVLDISIVNIALPSIRDDLGFTRSGLQWVVNGYTLAFGGLLLFGGRVGDLLGRRRVFACGVCAFALISLLGGFADEPGQLIAARAAQGVAGALVAPTALALISTTFPEGRQRRAAFGVYGAVSGSGAVIGLLLGGLLTDSLSWRWVLWVNVPIGAALACGALLVLPSSARRRGRFDLPGAISVTGGLTALVYGLVRAPQHGWTDRWTLTSFAAAAVLLVLFLLIEVRGRQPLMPLRVFADRDRSGAYAVTLLTGAALLSTLFFLAQFAQDVMGYSPLRNGVAFLPNAACVLLFSGLASRLTARVGAMPLMAAGAASMAVGLVWLSRLDVGARYATDLLPGLLLYGSGLGLLFVPLSMTAVATVADEDSGLASGLLNTAQQVGGSLGLATLSTVAADSTRDALPFGRPPTRPQLAHALAEGWATALSVSVAFVGSALVVVVAVIRARPGAAARPAEPATRQDTATPTPG